MHWTRVEVDQAKWYVAQLKAGRERIAIRGLGEQGFETYYPKMQVSRDHRGRLVDRAEPVFPAYAFLRSEPEPASWRAINGTRGVIRLLGNEQPCSVADRVITDLIRRDRAGLLRCSHRRQIRQGDTVEFKVGTFVGLQGVCQWTRRERIAVLLNVLGGDTVVTAARDWLRLAAA